MMLQLGHVPTLVVSSAEMAKEIMNTHDAVFCNRPELMVGKEVFYGSKDIGLAPYGEYWRQVCRISTLQLFTMKRVDSFRVIREEEGANMVRLIAAQALLTDAAPLNLSNIFFALACDIMCSEFNERHHLGRPTRHACRATFGKKRDRTRSTKIINSRSNGNMHRILSCRCVPVCEITAVNWQ